MIVPQKVSADDQTTPAQVLLFPAAELLDDSGRLNREIEVRVLPALSGQALTFPAGEPPAAQSILLPTPGIVQQYPFDSYTLQANVNASSGDPLVTDASLFFRVPGWSDQGAAPTPGSGIGEVISAQVVRNGSTKSIAFLLLLLMIILASIAILVTGSATRGRIKLELSVAAWMTGLLFALIPRRGFFPGSPPGLLDGHPGLLLGRADPDGRGFRRCRDDPAATARRLASSGRLAVNSSAKVG